MTISFNIDEILEMAEQIERNGTRFYSLAAERLKQHQDLFKRLAKQEEKHLAVFSGMRKKLSPADLEATSYDPGNENSLYLQALADREVFKIDENPQESFPPSITLAGAIDAAIRKEKDSIVFYAGMKKLVPEKLGREKINSIISEEYGHIAFLRGIVMKNNGGN